MERSGDRLKKPFYLGSVALPSNILCAPLAGCSDVPFRRMVEKYNPGLMYCEMVKMGALIHSNPQTRKLLDYDPSMRFIGGQICGSSPEMAEICAKMVEDLGFTILDLNCGCPVDKITKDGSGSGMLKTIDLIGETLVRMVQAVKIPVTVKIRAGWDADSIVGPEITQIAEQAGAVAIAIHGRTREQGYTGSANWDYIRECKRVAKNIKVIGNGDVVDGESAQKMFDYTGCDAVLVARGMMGQPWVIEDIYRHLAGDTPIKRTPIDSRDAFLEHLEHIVSYNDPKKAVLDLRRIGCWYLRNIQGARHMRESICRVQSPDEVRQIIHNSKWDHCEIIPIS